MSENSSSRSQSLAHSVKPSESADVYASRRTKCLAAPQAASRKEEKKSHLGKYASVIIVGVGLCLGTFRFIVLEVNFVPRRIKQKNDTPLLCHISRP